MKRPTAFIGLGANLGDSLALLKSAVTALRLIPDSELIGLSSLYRSAPLGPPGQADYLNAAACLRTGLTPHGLLAALQAIEQQHGRVREVRWGPRTLDLDLLLFGNDHIRTTELTVPHPELTARNFVLVPLLELAPALTLPNAQALAKLAVAHDLNGLQVACTGPQWGD